MYHSSRNCNKVNHQNFEYNLTCYVVFLRRSFPLAQLHPQIFNLPFHNSDPSSQFHVNPSYECCFLQCRDCPSIILCITVDHLGYLKCFVFPQRLHFVKMQALWEDKTFQIPEVVDCNTQYYTWTVPALKEVAFIRRVNTKLRAGIRVMKRKIEDLRMQLSQRERSP